MLTSFPDDWPRQSKPRLAPEAGPIQSVVPLGSFLEGITGRETERSFAGHLREVARRAGGLSERVYLSRPFCDLRHITCGSAQDKPAVLLVAPLAGQYAILLRDVVAGLLPDHDIYVTDWIDVREVPTAEGRFGLEENIACIMDFIRALGGGCHVLGLCQSAVPLLAAVALLAAAADPAQPRSMTLMGALVDTRLNPTPMNRLARRLSPAWLERTVISTVPYGFPGHGRRVYPAPAQRAALLTYLARRVEVLAGLPPRVRIFGDRALADPQFCKRLLTVMDLPAEIFLETLAAVLQDQSLARGTMSWQGRPVAPECIERTALMTIEGEFDDISGHGQTRAAHDLCRRIAARKRRHYEQAGVGHFGIFNGPSWFKSVAKRVRAFIRAQESQPA